MRRLSLFLEKVKPQLNFPEKILVNYFIPMLQALLEPEVLTVQLGVAIAVLATFLFFISFMGFYGALTKSQFLLFMYATLVLLLLLLECALLFYFSSGLMEKGVRKEDGQWSHAIRLALTCCEHNNTSPEIDRPPWSCCGPGGYPNNCTSSNIYKKNCHEAISSWLQRYQTAIYALLAATHLILASCSLIRRRRSASRFLS
ncbi:uncharacterized protein LOC114357181 isoform X2 [Ostrinia furnacalis]|uniref:uncharacterized protein LOC114357181 isoform X2 n=1 Tax=Ostrinia furnacalis TaxID=93504 RepID=UPI001040B1E6|nr:uncharacterized protein LOC114357181 isoform X2 [Ostrinia furnacalis]